MATNSSKIIHNKYKKRILIRVTIEVIWKEYSQNIETFILKLIIKNRILLSYRKDFIFANFLQEKQGSSV